MGIGETTIIARLKRGWEPGRAVTEPPNSGNYRAERWLTCAGRRQRLAAWAAELGINPQTITRRLARGWSIEEALS